ncbi:hypothetical protein AJ80_05126 [Polytolypa hystricis UAMH7299]|uniref:PAS domain-containing protein n=1 Tax=Polytolypa hystricis (strain UAMH7299) TaxID=1447883 RepID=A0A2B7XXW0_POLH7|nr:hypothetical protein AJ80_05126 [Polytolypa hystricis UAMH7299]
MEITFISIHDLSSDVRIRYVSGAVEDILGYQPSDVLTKPIWEYCHSNEIPLAKKIFARAIQRDQAAGLCNFLLRHKLGHWIHCESVFTIVHDVLVASTCIYQRDSKTKMRTSDASIVRRLFSSSLNDPGYHMLSCISSKISQLPKSTANEPRAALFLNRFTRSATIMFATNSVTGVLGLAPSDLISKSFYYCIEQCCLHQAVQCLEHAKANDTVAYLRFWFRNPSLDDEMEVDSDSEDDDGTFPTDSNIHDSEKRHFSQADGTFTTASTAFSHTRQSSNGSGSTMSEVCSSSPSSMWGMEAASHGRTLSGGISAPNSNTNGPTERRKLRIEIEAVVSCSSDGLVVVLRRARPLIPQSIQQPGHPVYANGLTAPPCHAANPTLSQNISQTSFNHPFSPSSSFPSTSRTGGPNPEDLMKTIREVTVLAGASARQS